MAFVIISILAASKMLIAFVIPIIAASRMLMFFVISILAVSMLMAIVVSILAASTNQWLAMVARIVRDLSSEVYGNLHVFYAWF